MKRLVVIGGGISGLCAAHAAARRAAAGAGGLEVLVLEAGTEVGGKARTVRRDGWLVETGPTGYLDNEPELEALLQRVGLAAAKVEANPAAARRYLLHGRLREVKANPLRLAVSGILGPLGFLRMAAEPFIGRCPPERVEGESIWEFGARRLGAQAADRLIAPMVLGVFAGDARGLSVAACFPKLVALEREHGSLIRGMLATRKARARDQRFATGPTGKLVSFTDGLQWLPRALADSPDLQVRCNARVTRIEREDSAGYRVFVAGDAQPIPADAVIFAGEAFAAAELLATVAPDAAAALAEIATPPVAVVALGYAPEVASRFPTGFGVLIPRDQGYRILGCIWDSQLFPGRSPRGHLLVRAMLGGGADPVAGGLAAADLLAIAREEVGRLFGIASEPAFTHVTSWPRAIPQYELDHLARVRRIEAAMERLPGLFLAGNGLHGVAFAKSAATGIRRGRAAAEWLTLGGL